MILAAGHGTRLRPLTEELPKPLVPIGDRALFDALVASLRAAGIARIVANAHHLRDAVVASGRAIDVHVVCEDTILGTAGGVRHAADALGDGEVLVVNGDILADLALDALASAHDSASAYATLAVAKVGPPGSGTVGLDEAGRVVRLRGESFGVERRGAEFVGTQILSADARADLPSAGCLVGDVYLPALRRGVPLEAAAVVRRFADVGTLESYLEENLAWLARQGLERLVLGSSTSGVSLGRVVVGQGARIIGEGTLEDVVVWPGATAVAPLQRAVVTPRRVVAVPTL